MAVRGRFHRWPTNADDGSFERFPLVDARPVVR